MTRRDPEMTHDDVDIAILLALVWRLERGPSPLPESTPWRLIDAASHCALLRCEFTPVGRPSWSVAVSDACAAGLLKRKGLSLAEAKSTLLSQGLWSQGKMPT